MIFNLFGMIILAALVVDFLLDLVGNLLNLRALQFELPPALQGLYPPDVYRKSQEYLRANTNYSLVLHGSMLAFLLVFWFLGGFNWLDLAIRGWNFFPLVNGLFYIGILFLVYNLFMLPFSLYHTFVIEARFGFNRTTPRAFVLDWVKQLVLTVVLGIVLVAGVLALFQGVGPLAWLYCWIMVEVVMALMQYIAPIWIMPLFFKFRPMDDGELKDAIMNYVHSVNFPIKNVVVMKASARSTKINAFFTGFGKNKRIALYDTLVTNFSVPEIVSVVAHEVGHYKKKHIIQSMILSIIQMGLIFFLLSLFIDNPGLYQAFFMDQASIYAGLLFFVLLFMPIQLAISILLNWVSRKHEYGADHFVVETTDEPRNHIEALKKLNAKNLGNLTPHPFFVFLRYSHPALLQRMQAIESAISKKSIPTSNSETGT